MRIPEWQFRAACEGATPLFFDDVGSVHGKPTPRAALARYRAKQICATCPVIVPCARHAENTEAAFGVYAGLDQQERSLLRAPYSDVRRLVTIALRMEEDGHDRDMIACVFGISRAKLDSWYAQSTRAPHERILIRQYRAWPMVMAGYAPVEIAHHYAITLGDAELMCKAVDSDPNYRGPKDKQRIAGWVRRRQPGGDYVTASTTGEAA